MAGHSTSERTRRIRRLPADAEREILDAAEGALGERAFREMSVEDVMRRTGMTRSTFYHYFRSIEDVAVALLQRVQAEMMEAATPWIEASQSEDPAGSIRRALREVAAVYARHASVLAAINEASYHHDGVERAWRTGVLEPWIAVVAEQLRFQEQAGVIRVENAEDLARALLLMNTAVFIERFGGDSPDPPEAVAETLARIWVGAIYPEALAQGG